MRWRETEEHWEGSELEPRDWQREALPLVLDALEAGEPGVVQAIMGAGKSLLIAEIIRSALLERGERIVVTTTTQQLVEQLAETIAERVGLRHVGRFYARAKNIHAPVIVTCAPSAPKLARALKNWGGYRCVLWIADEVHRTECDIIKTAHDTLAPHRAVGFSATPYRADKTEELSLWSHLIYSYGPGDGLEDGVVVPWRIVPWTGGKVPIDRACIAMLREAAGPGVVSASNIDDAEAFAEKLCDADIPAAAVHSRLDPVEIQAAIDSLERGDLRALVHVAMLQEGVDMPWLRWLCLRRLVSSPVRFAQEVGRALRSYPGKSEAIIYDPHDLFDLHQLSQEAVLQGMADEPEEGGGGGGPRERGEPKPKMARSLSGLETYLRRLVVALDECGVIRSRITGGQWRREQASRRQLSAIEEYASRLGRVSGLPGEHRAMLREVYRHRRSLKKGAASDFLSVIFELPRDGWPSQASQLVQIA